MGIAVGKVISGSFKALNMIQPVLTYRDNRKQGNGVASSLVKSAAETALYMSPAGGWLMTADIVHGVGGLALDIGNKNAAYSSRFYRGQFGGYFNLSQNGYTMRQRGVNVLEQSNNNLRQTLGSEARTYHKGNFY